MSPLFSSAVTVLVSRVRVSTSCCPVALYQARNFCCGVCAGVVADARGVALGAAALGWLVALTTAIRAMSAARMPPVTCARRRRHGGLRASGPAGGAGEACAQVLGLGHSG